MPPSVPSLDSLAAQARADLANGRWRKARDAFKELCKSDRTAFLPLLIEANVGLARFMLDKRLISDARQVLAYLKTIAPPEIATALEAEIGAAESGTSKVEPARNPVSLPDDGALSPDDRRRAADQLVVAFKAIEADATIAGRSALSDDLRAIHEALEAVCAGEHDRASDLVRPIKRNSAFAHWRLFVKALVAFQRDDADKATRYFAELPPDSVPGRARAAWLLALGHRDATTATPEPVLEAAGALLGESGWGRVLGRAEALWRAGKHAASYRAVRDGKASFPSEGVELSSAIASFYFNAVFSLGDNRLDAYVNALWEIEGTRRSKNPTELMMIRRTLCLLVTTPGDDFDTADLRAMWEGFIREYERAHGSNPRLASMAWAWLGEILARPMRQSGFGSRASQPRDLDRGVDALEKSIGLDPANADAHLTLASVYKTAKRTGDLNQLLELSAKRFPGNKTVLLAAGNAALDGKKYGKAVEHFDRALALDRLDPVTPDFLATACLRLAYQHYEKGRPHAARQMLDRVAELAVDLPDDFVRGRWYIGARHGVMESLFGDATIGEAMLEELRAATGSSVQFLFFSWMTWLAYDRARRFPPSLQRELDRVAKAEPNARDGAALIQIWKYWAMSFQHAANATKAWLHRYLKAAVRTPFTRDDAARVLAVAHRMPEFGEDSRRFVSRVLEGDANDPLFRLYRELLQPFPMLGRAAHDAILAEARRRGDGAAERLLREIAAEFNMDMGEPVPMPLPGGEEHAFEDDPWDLAGLAAQFGNSREETETLEWLELIARTPDSELGALKKKRPRAMPPRVFDLLVVLARGAKENPLIPRRGKPRPPSPRPEITAPRAASPRPEIAAPRAVPSKKLPATPDPDQSDLF